MGSATYHEIWWRPQARHCRWRVSGCRGSHAALLGVWRKRVESIPKRKYQVLFHSLSHPLESLTHVDYTQIIAASPYSVPIYTYDDPIPTGYYEEFVEKTGCGPSSMAKARYNSSFDCLVAAPSETLQNASGLVSESGLFGTFAFLPVVDNDLIRERPSAQLLSGKVSGQRILVGVSSPVSLPSILGYANRL